MTQKSESVREAEQRNAEIFEQARKLRDDLESYILLQTTGDPQIHDGGLYRIDAFLQDFAKSTTLKLAEEAEQEAREIQLASGYEYRKFREIAEWLRMKLERS